MSSNNIIFNLPQDMIVHILSCLPVKSLLHFRCVCKSFRPLISHPSFVKRHLSSAIPHSDDHRLLIYYETDDYKYEVYSLTSPITLQETLKLQTPDKCLHGFLRMAGSSKGLICFFDTNYFSNVGRVILWNPSVNKFKIVSDPVYDELHDNFSHFVVGFGFVLRDDDDVEFKVVEIVYYSDKVNVVNDVLVYSLGSNSWKKKDNMMAPCYLNRGWSSNVTVNNCFVNWLARKGPSKGAGYAIMAFDFDSECFGVVELPNNLVRGHDQLCLVSYGESMRLALCAHYKLNGVVDEWDMWVMWDYGLVDSWTKVCVVLQANLSNPPLWMKNDHEVLVVMNDGSLALFDAVKNQTHNLATTGLKQSFRAISYTASLALLDG